VTRRLGLGDELILYQATVGGEVTLYPDYPAAIETTILKERPDANAAIVLERARNELRRTAQLEILDPLGYDSTALVVVKTADAKSAKLRTMTDVENGPARWKLGVSYAFQQRADGLPALGIYNIPMAQSIRAMDAPALFPALQASQLNMIVAS